MTMYPDGYGTAMVTLDALRAKHEPYMHPEYSRRLWNWIVAQQGDIGIGGGYRSTGTQPDQPGFAPEGKSFHQAQTFASGINAYCAVDLVHVNPGTVHRSPTWHEVPAQGSSTATTWGVHCNVGTPGSSGSEPWHMQPIEIDGYDSWSNAGRKDPQTNYPIPGQQEPDMPREYIATPPPERPGAPWLLKINGAVSYATNADDGYPTLPLNAEQYDWLYRSVYGPFDG